MRTADLQTAGGRCL